MGKILYSFIYAFRGLRTLFATQRNAWIHAAATLAVVVAGILFHVTKIEWCLIIIACAGVWIAEALNTAIEFLGDAVTSEKHPLIGKAKDVAAGGVLISAIAAVIVGALVFTPYLFAH